MSNLAQIESALKEILEEQAHYEISFIIPGKTMQRTHITRFKLCDYYRELQAATETESGLAFRRARYVNASRIKHEERFNGIGICSIGNKAQYGIDAS